MCRHSYFCLLDVPGLCNARHIFHRRVWYRTLSLRYALAMRLFEVRTLSSALGYPCANFRFCRAFHCRTSPQKSRVLTHSLSHSPSLFGVPGTEAFASEYCNCKTE